MRARACTAFMHCFHALCTGVYDGAFFSFFCAEAGKHLVREAQLLDLATFRSGGGNVTVLDVGTGTGTVALGAARTLPDAVVGV